MESSIVVISLFAFYNYSHQLLCKYTARGNHLIFFVRCNHRDNSSSVRCEYYIPHSQLLSMYGVGNSLNLTLLIMLNFSDYSLKSVRIRWQFTKIKNDIYYTSYCMVHQIFSILTFNFVLLSK